jgi:hypothetical protein
MRRKIILLMTRRSERVISGPPFARNLVPGRNVDHIDRHICKLGCIRALIEEARNSGSA